MVINMMWEKEMNKSSCWQLEAEHFLVNLRCGILEKQEIIFVILSRSTR